MTKLARKSRAKPTPQPQPTADPPNEEWWTTATGQHIKVGNLDADHCRNVLRLVLRRCRQGELLTKRQAFTFVANALQEASQVYPVRHPVLGSLSNPAKAKDWDSEEQF